jgi:hypothetical protein
MRAMDASCGPARAWAIAVRIHSSSMTLVVRRRLASNIASSFHGFGLVPLGSR